MKNFVVITSLIFLSCLKCIIYKFITKFILKVNLDRKSNIVTD